MYARVSNDIWGLWAMMEYLRIFHSSEFRLGFQVCAFVTLVNATQHFKIYRNIKFRQFINIYLKTFRCILTLNNIALYVL